MVPTAEDRKGLSPALWAVTAAGNLAVAIGLFRLDTLRIDGVLAFFCLSALFLGFSGMSATLPSGASWRPSMTLIPAAIVLLPPFVGTVVAVPGLIYISYRAKDTWDKYLLLFSHVSLGVLLSGLLYAWLGRLAPFYPGLAAAGLASFAIHFLVNRAISVLILAYRRRRPIREQFLLTVKEIHWGYLTSYLITFLSAQLARDHGIYAILLGAVVQLGLFQSVLYYSRMRKWHDTALRDKLTGLGNRIGWEAFVHEEGKRASGSLAVIDLNHFKAVNDERGHLEGDKLLQEVGGLLRDRLPAKARAFRYGGDEFVVFCPHAIGEDANREAASMLHGLADELSRRWEHRGLEASASLGVALYPSEARSLQELFYLADRKMYLSKAAMKSS